ncbi:MAG: translocation/assembly module TamB domain-containing protein [Deltaproteobacteria bacterium]|nr:translocation/assembly module TamB domain-containing protein [Deltaproteobacteria bacterium]
MKRAAKQTWAALLAAAIIGAAVWGAAWLFGTAAGARWIMDQLSRRTPLSISARQVEGRLLDGLRLGGVRITLTPLTVDIDRLDCAWQPLLLLSRRISVRELALTGLRIQDDTPADSPTDLTWPQLSRAAAFFDGRIERLSVSSADYRRLDGEPVRLDSLSTSVAWQRGLLSLSGLAATSPVGRLSGTVAAGFDRPDLQVDLTATLTRPWARMEAFSLRGRFLPGRGGEQLAGRFTWAAARGKANFLELSGEAGMTPNAFNLRGLRLAGPGRRGSLAGTGSVTLSAQAPLLAFDLKADRIDLSPELGAPTDLSGTLTFTGTPEHYRGEFALSNKGKAWRTARLSGSYQGDVTGVKLSPLTGSLLAGSVRGNVELRWERGLSMGGTLHGRNLDPAGLSPDWTGMVNFDMAGQVDWPGGNAPPRGRVNGRLLESRLHGRPLTGELAAEFAGGDLDIRRLVLQGKGFDIQAAGLLTRRLEFNARVGDLGRLLPQTAGELKADGWVRQRDGRWDGAAQGRGVNWAVDGLRIAAAEINAQLGRAEGYPLNLTARLRGVAYGHFHVDSATIDASGTALRHTARVSLITTGAEARISCGGSYDRGAWRGEITRLDGRDGVGPWRLEAPAALTVSAGKVSLAPLALAGVRPERLQISGEVMLEPLGGSLRTSWDGLNLARVNPWLSADLRLDGRLTGRAAAEIRPQKQLDVSGQTSWVQGRVRWSNRGDALDAVLASADFSGRWQGALPGSAAEVAEGRLALSGQVAASGTLTMAGQRIGVEKGSLHLDGSERGWNGRADCSLAGGGTVKGFFSSLAPARPAVPATGDVTLEWSGIDPARFRPWIPPEIRVEGLLSGRAAGSLLPEQRLSLKGSLSWMGGKVTRTGQEGEVRLNLRSASVLWEWQGEALRGDLSLALMEHGEARGSFQLPIPARRPLSVDRNGPLLAALTIRVREAGFLTSLFPGLIRESSGEVRGELRVNGSWTEPLIGGDLKLSKAGAYLPTAGIHVHDLELAMRIEKELLRIYSFRAVSGPGHVEGSAQIRLRGWQVAGYSGNINGERFQLVYFPELQIQGSPRLTFEGTTEKLTVRGELRLPELLITGPPTRAVVQPSRDVIVEGAPKPTGKSFPLALDVQVLVTLGERVLARVEGIDAQLSGGIDLIFQNLDRITSRGEIRVVKGRYRAYGVDLEIVRGRLFYAGGPINQPTLDILALRTAGEVRAGVTAGGIIRAPVIKLYSEPAMPDVDILSYIVFGRALGSSSTTMEQAGMMAQVASVLLSRGQSVALQEQIKNRLGLSTLEIQSDSTQAARMGYREIPSAPARVAPAATSGSVSQTVLTVGKYLTPELYFSYGRSLFTGGNLFRLRYDLSRQWQIETQTGSESGGDIYYRIEFD